MDTVLGAYDTIYYTLRPAAAPLALLGVLLLGWALVFTLGWKRVR